jgi:hypothetical protein
VSWRPNNSKSSFNWVTPFDQFRMGVRCDRRSILTRKSRLTRIPPKRQTVNRPISASPPGRRRMYAVRASRR